MPRAHPPELRRRALEHARLSGKPTHEIAAELAATPSRGRFLPASESIHGEGTLPVRVVAPSLILIRVILGRFDVTSSPHAETYAATQRLSPIHIIEFDVAGESSD
jgi:hypothetical protein